MSALLKPELVPSALARHQGNWPLILHSTALLCPVWIRSAKAASSTRQHIGFRHPHVLPSWNTRQTRCQLKSVNSTNTGRQLLRNATLIAPTGSTWQTEKCAPAALQRNRFAVTSPFVLLDGLQQFHPPHHIPHPHHYHPHPLPLLILPLPLSLLHLSLLQLALSASTRLIHLCRLHSHDEPPFVNNCIRLPGSARPHAHCQMHCG